VLHDEVASVLERLGLVAAGGCMLPVESTTTTWSRADRAISDFSGHGPPLVP
jgi:hypothetical protein